MMDGSIGYVAAVVANGLIEDQIMDDFGGELEAGRAHGERQPAVTLIGRERGTNSESGSASSADQGGRIHWRCVQFPISS